MDAHFQTATLVASPSYPNSIAWSEENLVAVASGRLITILNPSSLLGPRGVIKISRSTQFSLGVVERQDLLSPCLMPISLSREDSQPCARSISWSHPGLAPNAGCLLAVCATDGCVKIYRPPFCEFSSEWIEVTDITTLLYDYFASINFREDKAPPVNYVLDSVSSTQSDQSRPKKSRRMVPSKRKCSQFLAKGNNDFCNRKSLTIFTEEVSFPSSIFEISSLVEVLKEDASQRIWVSGTIESMDVAKAFVLFQDPITNGESGEWFDLNLASALIKDSNAPGSVMGDCDLLPNIRPYMNLGNIPKGTLLSCHGVEEVLKIGQPVEASLMDRWVEGIFMGFSGQYLLVKFSGCTRCVTLDATTIRLAPIWKGNLKSWQVTLINIEDETGELSDAGEDKSEIIPEANFHTSLSMFKSEGKRNRTRRKKKDFLQLTAEQYASRAEMLQSLVISWSPVLGPSCESSSVSLNTSSSNYCAILAVGGKSGKVSFWRIHEPQCYTIEHSMVSVDPILIGLLQAHNSWITAIGWGLYDQDASDPQFVLATGSSNGSVKIWHGAVEGLLKSSKADAASFMLLEEVTTFASEPVSTLSLFVPKYQDKILIAIGRGSGAVEVWVYYISSCKFQNFGSYISHDQVVTGLAWAFDGSCLYSSSQDNSVRSWILHGGTLESSILPLDCQSGTTTSDLSLVFDSCFGLALSPGNLMGAVVRNCDLDLLDQMYQARTQKAAVEFFWTGGQKLQISSGENFSCNVEAFPGLFLGGKLPCWECNILCSLKQYEDISKPLVLWDVITVLTALNRSAPNFVEHLLCKWLSSWFGGCDQGVSTQNILLRISSLFSSIGSRRLHLLNIICRRLTMSMVESDWSKILTSSETELRERLVAISFSAALSCTDLHFGMHWLPVGVAQMEQWLAGKDDLRLQNRLKALRSRNHSLCEYTAEEKCSFCSASVPFESPEYGYCKGTKGMEGEGLRHKLQRCAVSMLVNPPTTTWFCMCCQRWISKPAPWYFFTMAKTPSESDFKSPTKANYLQEYPKPFCPFCGILLQRFLPDFLLSPSLV